MTDRALIDAKAAGELLGVPHTWLLRQARRDAVPHIRLGHYVRFDADELLAWARNRRRDRRIFNSTQIAALARRTPPRA